VDWKDMVLGYVRTGIYVVRHQNRKKTRIILVQAPYQVIALAQFNGIDDDENRLQRE
jgi:hypothetical protein